MNIKTISYLTFYYRNNTVMQVPFSDFEECATRYHLIKNQLPYDKFLEIRNGDGVNVTIRCEDVVSFQLQQPIQLEEGKQIWNNLEIMGSKPQ